MATVTITTAQLRKAARWAKPDPKNPLPILGNVRVSVAGHQLVIASFDWETCRLARFCDDTADPAQTASVLVPAVQLDAAMKLIDAARVEVTVQDGDKVDLVTGTGPKAQRVSVGQSFDPACYPALPQMPPITGWADSSVLVPALTQVAGCCSDDDTLPVIRSVHFLPSAGTLGLEGTSRYILGLDEVPFNAAVLQNRPKPAGFLIPGPLLTRFIRGCEEGPVFIGAPGADGMAFLSDSWHSVITKVTGGDYPRVRSIANRTPPCTAEFTTGAATLIAAGAEANSLLAEAVEQMIAAAIADKSDTRPAADKRRKIHMDHDGHGMFLTVSPAGTEIFAVHPGTGQELGRWQVAGTTAETEVTVCLNPGYLVRVLPETGQVTVRLSTPHKPVRVTADGALYEGVICPLRLDPPVRAEQEKETVTV